MSVEHPAGYGERGHNAPLRNDLPPKPEPWSPRITGWRNTYVEDHIDWIPMKRDPLGPPDEQTREIADNLVKRIAAEREQRAAAGEGYY